MRPSHLQPLRTNGYSRGLSPRVLYLDHGFGPATRRRRPVHRVAVLTSWLVVFVMGVVSVIALVGFATSLFFLVRVLAELLRRLMSVIGGG